MATPAQNPSEHPTGHRDPSPKLQIQCFHPGPYQTNCYLIWVDGQPECWLVDLGFEPGAELDRVAKLGLKPSRLLLTHAHVDHIAGVRAFRERFPGVPVALHGAEREFLSDPELNLSAFMGRPISEAPAEEVLHADQQLELSGTRWRVVHVPGHSPGGVGFYCEGAGLIIAGDALFQGSIGRTDFPTSDHDLLLRAIRERMYTLPPKTVVMPGHGPSTTIERERKTNPFVRA